MNGRRARAIRRLARENAEFFERSPRSLARRLRRNANPRRHDHVPLGLEP